MTRLELPKEGGGGGEGEQGSFGDEDDSESDTDSPSVSESGSDKTTKDSRADIYNEGKSIDADESIGDSADGTKVMVKLKSPKNKNK